jgi:hypothetical protein
LVIEEITKKMSQTCIKMVYFHSSIQHCWIIRAFVQSFGKHS